MTDSWSSRCGVCRQRTEGEPFDIPREILAEIANNCRQSLAWRGDRMRDDLLAMVDRVPHPYSPQAWLTDRTLDAALGAELTKKRAMQLHARRHPPRRGRANNSDADESRQIGAKRARQGEAGDGGRTRHTLATEMPRYRCDGQGNSGPDNHQQYCLMKFHERDPVLLNQRTTSEAVSRSTRRLFVAEGRWRRRRARPRGRVRLQVIELAMAGEQECKLVDVVHDCLSAGLEE